MHTKQKGIIGELAVAKFLAEKEIPVFTELGDLSKVDLIALIDNKPVKIQVKARTFNKTNVLEVRKKSSGPNYIYDYTEDQVDVFAVVCLDTGDILWVLAKELLSVKAMTFRKERTSKGESNLFSDYDFNKLLTKLLL